MAKAPSKTQIKTDNAIRAALQAICDSHAASIDGLQRFHHQANYTNFPASLMITGIFDSIANAEAAEAQARAKIATLIQAKLLKVGVRFKSLDRQIMLDSEEACQNEHQGDWDHRFASRAERAVAKNRPADARY